MKEESKKSINQMKKLVGEDAAKEVSGENARYIRPKQGVEIYNMSRTQFVKLAAESGGLYRIGTLILVERDTFERYLESFRIPATGGIYGL